MDDDTIKRYFNDETDTMRDRTKSILESFVADSTPKRSADSGIDPIRQNELRTHLYSRQDAAVDIEARDNSLFVKRNPRSSPRRKKRASRGILYNDHKVEKVDYSRKHTNRSTIRFLEDYAKVNNGNTLPVNEAKRVVRSLIHYGLPLTYNGYLRLQRIEKDIQKDKREEINPKVEEFREDYRTSTGREMNYNRASSIVILLISRNYDITYSGFISYMEDRRTREELTSERRVSRPIRNNGFKNNGRSCDST
ncbi:MAG: hypothetical protein AABW52_02660 [Nanoarchaeota archaeon]